MEIKNLPVFHEKTKKNKSDLFWRSKLEVAEADFNDQKKSN